jgi:hypothetical protein
MAIKVVFITSTGSYTIPSDFVTLVSVEAIGAGAGGKPSTSGIGGEGGGGGAYASSNAVTGITASGTVYVSTGIGGTSGVAGGDTWFNAASNAAPTLTTQGALAKGGAIGAANVGGLGGSAAASVGTTKNSGGNGGASVAGAFGGGGGAAGPSGVGAAGGSATSVNGGGGGGGGSNGGSVGSNGTTVGGNGGNGLGGTGAGAGGNNANGSPGTAGTGAGGGGGQGSTFIGGNGATGSVWTQTSDSATAGPGGGGGGTWYFGTTGGNGGLYGGGGGGAVTGGTGGGGIIVLTYSNTSTAILATRITNTGNLLVNGTFDEVTSITPATFRTTANTVYAATLDEVTYSVTNPVITNIYTYTEQFDNAAWPKQNGTTIAVDATLSPIGTMTADKIQELSTTSFFGVVRSPAGLLSTTYSYSIYAKAAERTQLSVAFTTVTNGTCYFTLTGAGSISAQAGISATISNVGNGWYRCTGTFTTASSGVNPLYHVIVTAANNGGTVVGVAGYGVYIWGAQLELGSTPTIYQGVAAAGTLVTPNFAKREAPDGTMYVTGIFDEVTNAV